MRASVYYPWVRTDPPAHQESKYVPSKGSIDGRDPATIRLDTTLMAWAGFDTVIVSYWGDREEFEAVLEHSVLPVCPLVEPTVDPKELDWLNALYGRMTDKWYTEDAIHSQNWLGEYPVLLVYNKTPLSQTIADKWLNANEERFYLAMRAGPYDVLQLAGVDHWYAYDPTQYVTYIDKQCVSISPGFWQYDEDEPRLERNLGYFRWGLVMAAAALEQKKVPWLICTTFSEYHEGTQVEPYQSDPIETWREPWEGPSTIEIPDPWAYVKALREVLG